MTHALVYGVAVSGEAVLRGLLRRGYTVEAADDRVTDATRALAADLGIELAESPDAATIAAMVRRSDLVAPAPGVAEDHPVVTEAIASGCPLRSEIDLAYEWEQQREGGPRPMLAVTGTDGKTTTTLLATAMLAAAGVSAVAAGNTDLPLVAAIDDATADAFVVECSSFRLRWTSHFRPDAAVWLNLAPDHLNWHRDMGSYVDAKARIWTLQRPGDVAIGFVDDPVVMQNLARAPGRRVTFGLAGGDYHCTDLAGRHDVLTGPCGPLVAAAEMRRSLPHDITNALAAAAVVQQPGLADSEAISTALRSFVGPAHRLEAVGRAGGVTWFNDSKATTPHAALTAIRAFTSVVLIAGGRNKGLDLHDLGTEPQRMRGVVAIGEASDAVVDVFAGTCPVARASSMTEAVALAAAMARPGDAVVLSPAHASFDWYPVGGYPARGDDFRRTVEELLG